MVKSKLDNKKIENEILAAACKRLSSYEQLVSLAEEQQEILVEGRHNELADNTAAFDPVLLEIKQLDKREEMLFQRLKKTENSENPNNIDIRCREVNKSTIQAAARLRRLMEANERLMNNALQLIDFSMGIICKVAAESASGTDARVNPALAIDLKV